MEYLPQAKNKSVCIIGSGIMGLSVAYFLSKKGYAVSVYEKENECGGLATSVLMGNTWIEKYYKFICRSDFGYINFLNELGLQNNLRWKHTEMGFYYGRKLMDFSGPIDLLRFNGLSISAKFRYALHIFESRFKIKWDDLENISAIEWLEEKVGDKCYKVIWDKMIKTKFWQYQNQLSAAWIWARIKRVGESRTITGKEILGYIEGGTKLIIDTLMGKILENNGQVYLNNSVKEIFYNENQQITITTNGGKKDYDILVSTVPVQTFTDIKTNFDVKYIEKILQIKSIGVVCALFKLKERLSKYFWANLNDSRMLPSGIIEYTNLNPLNNNSHIVYVPIYLLRDDPLFLKEDQFFIHEYISTFKLINPNFSEKTIEEVKIFRNEYAQPLCEIGFTKMIPPLTYQGKNLFICDHSYYFPHDRYFSKSIDFAKKIVMTIEEQNDTCLG